MVKAKQLNSGNWRCQVYDYTDDMGKRHYKSFTAPTAREAEYQAITYQMRRERDHRRMTLEEAYTRYVADKYNILSPSTRRGYVSARKNHFQNLMNMDIGDITEDLVQYEVNKMIALQYTPKTIRNQYGLLVSVMGLYRRNFTMRVSLPKKRKPFRYIPSSSEVQQLFESADEVIRVPIILASQGSLRCSEICAITPQSITPKGVWVTQAVVMDENCHYISKLPKTDAGYRFTPLCEESIALCREWSHFGITPRYLEKKFHQLCEKSGIPTTLHKLRHWWACKLHQHGVPDVIIMQYGGWEDVKTLYEVYLHALPEYEEENQKIITNLLGMNEYSLLCKVKSDSV